MVMTKFEKIKQQLRTEWGFQLFKGEKSFGYGFSTGYIIIADKGDQRRYSTLRQIERMLNIWL